MKAFTRFVPAVAVAWWVCSGGSVPSARAGENNARFTGKYTGSTGEVEVTPAAGNKLHVQFVLQASGLGDSGEIAGDVAVKNGNATLTSTNFGNCKLAMQFGSSGTLHVTQTGDAYACGFGANVTADGDYVLEKPAPETQPAVAIPGAPSAAECARSTQPSGAPAGTQLALNAEAAEKAMREACAMRAAYERLDKSLGSKAKASERLRVAQEKWSDFLDAHEKERFPHEGEQSYYGSMLPMCIAGENQSMYHARALELRSLLSCRNGAASLDKARQAGRRAEALLADAVRSVRTREAKDPKAVAALAQAQLAFRKLVAAQIALVSVTDGGNAACAAHELEHMRAARTQQLWALLKAGGCR